ncbi:MAG TPA: pitrilysin family protein [Burkholderiales bacterium]|nr:pitrilysin family protein [Burkholderiales bacterium]
MPIAPLYAARVALACLGAALIGVNAAATEAPRRVAAIEGVTEYRLDNGLRVLTVPDPGIDTLTVHITYLVGSRQEDYGEKGMAHLLEHMLFKGAPRHPDLKREFAARGARWNGTTAYDRTNYFETMPASEANLDWALGMEADRMVNSFIAKADLESEMTVVRNEFEMGENDPGAVLFQRTLQLAYAWHNYGHPVIGARSDIENVPIARLQAFYRTWYQPDNALLIVAGRFDPARALELVQKYFAPIPRPARELPSLYTEEPAQDGARSVTLRRVGEAPIVSALYRIPAGSDPDYPALDVLVSVLGSTPSGRLHRALVKKGLANYTWGSERALHDPGFASFGAGLPKDASVDAARDALLAELEGIGRHPVRAEELRRAKTELLNDFDKAQRDTRALVPALSEFAAIGDWRLFFLYRDRLRAVSGADVQRVAVSYLKPANRVLGVFLPTRHPERAEIPPAPDLEQALAGYRGGEAPAAGEAFDPTPANIEARVTRRTLANGIRVALLPKKTRGHTVVARLLLHWGDEQSMTGRVTDCSLAGSMLERGTRGHSRAELRDAFERLSATAAIGGDGARLEVPAAGLADALRLVAEALQQPAFPPEEFEALRRARLTDAEELRSDPTAIAGLQLSRHLNPYPRGHPYYTETIDEDVAQLQTASVTAAEACYRELLGATGADFAAVGEFDPAVLARQLEELFGGWKTPRPFERVAARYYDQPPLEGEFRTPDKANAALRAGFNVALRDDDPDYPALLLANYLLGGSLSARIPQRVRETEGLSYSVYTTFSAGAFYPVAAFRVSAIFAPGNKARVEQAVREELARAVRDGFGAAEVKSGAKALVEARRLGRRSDRALAERLADHLYRQRGFDWDARLEQRIATLSAKQVNAALRRHLDPARLSVMSAGDFR